MADLEGINGQRKDFNVVGKPNLPGRLSRAIATGIAKYGIDYEAGGKIEEKLTIATTSKGGHGIEKIKRTYTTWSSTGRSSSCLENKENVF